MAVFSYLWILILIPFLTDAKNDPLVKFHLKQGLTLIIFDVIGWALGMVIGWLPVIGWLVVWLWGMASIVFAIIGIMNVLGGHEKELPFIGSYAKNFNI